MNKNKLAFVLGIRPDIIRASLILEHLRKSKDIETTFVWSGQHYDYNLKGVFLKGLGVKKPDVELNCSGKNDADTVSQLINKLYSYLSDNHFDAVVYLGDTNTVASCIAPALLNIPIVHIEGGMRSYDWRMPEEKYRTVSDHLSDLIYVYSEEYKWQAVNEGINPNNIVVVGNPIVDIINRFYKKNKKSFNNKVSENFFVEKDLEKNKYYVMTWHRRENLYEKEAFKSILNLISKSPNKIYFPASYRTQKLLIERKVKLPEHIVMVDPIGYKELIILMVNSRGVLTDSGTIIEETTVLGIPGIQMRHSTERPQVYDAGGAVKFDPMNSKQTSPEKVFNKLESLIGKKWDHNLGDGKTSERIAKDLIKRLKSGNIKGHKPKNYHIPIYRSYREDGIKI